MQQQEDRGGERERNLIQGKSLEKKGGGEEVWVKVRRKMGL
jgi:hypothetical protein